MKGVVLIVCSLLAAMVGAQDASGPSAPGGDPYGGGLVYDQLVLPPTSYGDAQYGVSGSGQYFVGASGSGAQPGSSDSRLGPITFGPEHARPAVTPPNAFRQGPAAQALLQQRHLQAQQQLQQQAFALPNSPSARYASLDNSAQQQIYSYSK